MNVKGVADAAWVGRPGWTFVEGIYKVSHRVRDMGLVDFPLGRLSVVILGY